MAGRGARANGLRRHLELTLATALVLIMMALSATHPQLFEAPLPIRRRQQQRAAPGEVAGTVTAVEAQPEPQPTTTTAREGSLEAEESETAQLAATRDPRCNGGNRREWRPAKCQDDKSWLVPWVEARPAAAWTLVDVGANKGYVIAEWLEVLLGPARTQSTPHNLGVQLYSTSITADMFKSACGGCCECVEQPARIAPEKRASSVRVYAFEPSPANYRWLHSFFTDARLVNVTHAAVSDRDSVAYFPDNPLGVEIGKVRDAPARGHVEVRVVRLDTYLAGVDFIDVLSTDAEGFDQDVARGAASFLRGGRVGVYQFEMYRAEDYKRIFAELGSWGYVCYFATESRAPRVKVTSVSVRGGVRRRKDTRYKVPMLVRITDCWDEAYRSYTGWVNGLCYNRRVPHLEPIFERLARTLHQGGNGNCPTRVSQRRTVLDFVGKFVTSKKEAASSVMALESDLPEHAAAASGGEVNISDAAAEN